MNHFFRKSDLICLVVVCCIGALVSALPHLIWYWNSGSSLWIADYDELGAYLPVVSQSYFNHQLWFLDPAIILPGPTSFPWLQMFPGHFINWLFNFEPSNVFFIWRIGAGVSIAAGWFILLRQLINSKWLAMAATIWLLFDGGILSARLGINSILNILSAGWNDLSPLLASKPLLHPQWRIITPGLSWFYLSLFLIAMTAVQRRVGERKSWIIAGMTFGLQFYSYFFFWTTCGLGLLISVIFDKSHRREYFKIGLLGLLLGLPSLAKDTYIKMMFSQDWLLRADRFLPIERFSELLIPKTGFLLAVIVFFVVQYRHKDLKWMWYQILAGLLLLNHQIFTGLQIENFHWSYAWAPLLSILLLVVCIRELEAMSWLKRRNINTILAFILVLHVSSGFWLRYREATKSLHTLELRKHFDRYQVQRSVHGRIEFDPQSALAGENWYMNYAIGFENVRPLVTYTTIFSPSVNDSELYERMALNAILSGHTFEMYHAEQAQLLETTPWGPWQRNLKVREETLSERLTIFREVEKDTSMYIKKFNVKHLALIVGDKPPSRLKFTLIQEGPIWSVWTIEI